MSDGFNLRDLSVTGSAEITLDAEQYRRMVGAFGNPAASLTVEKRIHDPRPRALWGARRRWIQVGSPEDADAVMSVNLPHVEFHSV